MKQKRKPRPVRCPTMVAMMLAPEVELTERMALQAFIGAWAGERQFDVLADVRDLLALAAGEKNDAATLHLCDLAFEALTSIKHRYLKLNKMGATGEELKALRVLVDVSEDFWRRQGGTLYHDANMALDKARGFERERKNENLHN